eukprot:11873029-Alexandrium_andersonii.AAC.1
MMQLLLLLTTMIGKRRRSSERTEDGHSLRRTPRHLHLGARSPPCFRREVLDDTNTEYVPIDS